MHTLTGNDAATLILNVRQHQDRQSGQLPMGVAARIRAAIRRAAVSARPGAWG